jgi:aryl-alcohol dehydrogenase-like predicted oxidoreductase
MDYIRLATSELMVSRIALGCMGFAGPARLSPAWTLDEDAAGPIFRQAAELGVTFWDTANVYSNGTSEEIAGRAIRNYARRDEAVLATKVGMRVLTAPGNPQPGSISLADPGRHCCLRGHPHVPHSGRPARHGQVRDPRRYGGLRLPVSGARLTRSDPARATLSRPWPP